MPVQLARRRALRKINPSEISRQCVSPIWRGECSDELAAFRCGVEACGRVAPIRPMAPCNLQIGGEPHGQVREPLRGLWWKVWPRLPSPLGAALLPQSLQGQLSCEIREGLCALAKVVRQFGSGSWHRLRSVPSAARALSSSAAGIGHSFEISGRFPVPRLIVQTRQIGLGPGPVGHFRSGTVPIVRHFIAGKRHGIRAPHPFPGPAHA